jgi:hypothetical protein
MWNGLVHVSFGGNKYQVRPYVFFPFVSWESCVFSFVASKWMFYYFPVFVFCIHLCRISITHAFQPCVFLTPVFYNPMFRGRN